MNLIKKILSIFRGYKMYTLVVVDMQPAFRSSQNQETLDRVNELIQQAIKDDAPIVFLEFGGYEKTDSRLLASVEGYKQAHFQVKYENDGSFHVKKTIDAHDLPTGTIRVCGVNTNYCVRETVLGLIEKNLTKKIEVSKKGTNCNFYHLPALKTMKGYESVKLID